MSSRIRRAALPGLPPPRGPFGQDGAGLAGATDDDDVEALVEAEHLLLDAFSDVRGDGFRFPQGDGESDALPDAAGVPFWDPGPPLREVDSRIHLPTTTSP